MIRIRHGNAIVDVSGNLERQIRGVLDRLAPTLSQRLEDEVRELRTEAESRWPVGRDRGRPHSRDMFVHGIRIDGDAVSAYVRNNANYAVYVRSYQNGLGGKSAAGELLRKPLKESAAEVARDCAEQIRLLVKGAR